ncbi:hypothetical protein ANANG_G00277390 [Anguilla anguilla]|uniref:Secreted protein n=1 Tax=Anguilla anguilla TaxID=7936 RepID=A0A9D3RK79_ANGAN|nr:hypothetical protein ANANG_G00277390 [Anguilla anguilla]
MRSSLLKTIRAWLSLWKATVLWTAPQLPRLFSHQEAAIVNHSLWLQAIQESAGSLQGPSCCACFQTENGCKVGRPVAPLIPGSPSCTSSHLLFQLCFKERNRLDKILNFPLNLNWQWTSKCELHAISILCFTLFYCFILKVKHCKTASFEYFGTP